MFNEQGNHLRWASEVWQGLGLFSTGERQTVVDLLRSIVHPFPAALVAWARGECVDGRGDLWGLYAWGRKWNRRTGFFAALFYAVTPWTFSMNGWRLPTLLWRRAPW